MGMGRSQQVVPDPTDEGGNFRIAGAEEHSDGLVGTYVPLEDDGAEDVVPEALLQGLSGAEVDLLMLDLQGTNVMLSDDQSLDTDPAPAGAALSRAEKAPPASAPRKRSRSWAPSLAPVSEPLPSEVSDDDLLDLDRLKAGPPPTPLRPQRVDIPETSGDLSLSIPSDPVVQRLAGWAPVPMPTPSPRVVATARPASAPVASPEPPGGTEPDSVDSESEDAAQAPSLWARVSVLFTSVFPR